jgi:uncharacterized paraquat-inducible protein A
MKNLDNTLIYILSIGSYVFALNSTLFTTSGDILGISFKEEHVTFFKSIAILENQGYVILSYALIFFVLVIPCLKYITLLLNLFSAKLFTGEFNEAILYLQKYAMVDVFVIALLLIGSKNNPIFDLKIELGTYALLVSIITSMILSINLKLKRKTEKD